MNYQFKVGAELAWAAFIAAALVVLQALVTLEPEMVSDWQAWAIAIGGGALRAAVAVVIAALTKRKLTG